jgi:CheY-like chemotaxis protein
VDVLVSDIRLAGEKDGLELIQAVRARPAPLGRLPAIVAPKTSNKTSLGTVPKAEIAAVLARRSRP